MRARPEVEPPRAWYYQISPNSRTLVILLQVDPASGDKPKTGKIVISIKKKKLAIVLLRN